MQDKIQVIDYETSCKIDEHRRYKVQYHTGDKWRFLGLYADTDLMTLDEAKDFIKKAKDFAKINPNCVGVLYQIRKHVSYVMSPEGIAYEKDMKAIKANYPKWVQVAKSTYLEALGMVPPIYFQGGWAMSEAERHTKDGVEYTCFVQRGNKFYACQNTIKQAVITQP